MTASTTPSYSTDTGYTGSAGGSTGVAFDFSPFLDRMATALETIATNSTTIATNTTNISNTLTNIKSDVDILTKLAQGSNELIATISATILGASGQPVITTTSTTSGIEKGQLVTGTGVPISTYVSSVTNNSVTLTKNLTSAASGTYSFYKAWIGIHTIGPYEWLNYASLYHLYIEQGKLTKDSEPVATITGTVAANIITTTDSANLILAGQLVKGTGVPDNTYVSHVTSDIGAAESFITLTQTITNSDTYEFYNAVSDSAQEDAIVLLNEYVAKIKSLPTIS
jgi:hypothetical protein